MKDNKRIKCFIVDDEPPARHLIRRYIEQTPSLEFAGECVNALEAISALQQQSVDLLFLDINMPQLKGNELLRILKTPPAVIFTTAHSEYALEGYELDILDYLLKPVQFDRFLKAVHKFRFRNERFPGVDAASNQASPSVGSFVYFRSDRKMVKVLLDDILYIESMKDYAKVYTLNEMIITKQSMTSLEAMLPEHMFIRTHRSFIVSLSKIRSFTTEIIEVDKAEVPIGKLFRNSVLKVLSKECS